MNPDDGRLRGIAQLQPVEPDAVGEEALGQERAAY